MQTLEHTSEIKDAVLFAHDKACSTENDLPQAHSSVSSHISRQRRHGKRPYEGKHAPGSGVESQLEAAQSAKWDSGSGIPKIMIFMTLASSYTF